MTDLMTHAAAARIIGQAFSEESTNPHISIERRHALKDFGTAYMVAAGMMEAKVKADAIAQAEARRCTFDHAKMPGPKCLGCGAPRAPK